MSTLISYFPLSSLAGNNLSITFNGKYNTAFINSPIQGTCTSVLESNEKLTLQVSRNTPTGVYLVVGKYVLQNGHITAERKSNDMVVEKLPDTPLQSSIDWPPWNQQSQIEIVKDIDGVTSKKSMIKREFHCLTQNMLDKKYPSNYWIRAFTDGSASEAVRDGGGGVYIEWPDNSSSKISIPTGKKCTNYKAEAEALQEAAKVLVNNEANHYAKVVLLTDARSVLDALDSTKCPEVNALAQAITTLNLAASKLVLQWIPIHVDIFADQLAKEGGTMEQIQHNPSYNEAKHSSTSPLIVIGGKNTLSTTPRMPFTSSQGLSRSQFLD
ncbi:ribonuclease H [Elysia marginata]|uniref:Ribonuclease H n=1 Tax=Elysia marginata TaxID=1093978 RepID=A0AAV4IAY7_9GAST|nr:ribonuclease H [Elysia marginata]